MKKNLLVLQPLDPSLTVKRRNQTIKSLKNTGFADTLLDSHSYY